MDADAREAADKEINECLAKLAVHFNAVQIMASVVDEEGYTACRKLGIGNWYARVGMAREFLNEDQSRDAAIHIAQALEDDE